MTININELRRLAQAATPGPWWVNQDGLNHGFERGVLEINANDWHALAGAWAINGAKPSEEGAANAAYIAAANPAAISELLDRLEATEKEREMDEERIANLMADLNRIGHENDALRTALADLLNDLEERAKWNLEASQRVVACGNSVYVRAKAALEGSR